jgi:hypothetical protein
MRTLEMDRWADFTDADLRDRTALFSSSVVLTMADTDDLTELTARLNEEVTARVQGPETLRGLVRYVLGTDIADDDERAGHLATWRDVISDRIDAEVEEKRGIKAELARREYGGADTDTPGEWAEFDTTDLKYWVTDERFTTRFAPNDKADIGNLVEEIKHMRRRRAVASGEKLGGPAIGESLVIRTLIRVATGRGMPAEQQHDHAGLVVRRIAVALEHAAQERLEIAAELRRRGAPAVYALPRHYAVTRDTH